ncbi:hypothetical protein LXA47_23775 [Massilia sp. P8910]|uniref:hypothetical protein n=1 Tax=Massilia antarctica TaxID=2765360 RepID=UPI001E587C54|nr:hypothetical protein [Massilia antarctica]MCE3606595.1 hypothetical protein [Massilia antarctica]
MKINFAGRRFIAVSIAVTLTFAFVTLYRTDIVQEYFHIADKHPLWIRTSVPIVLLFALALAFICRRKKRPS